MKDVRTLAIMMAAIVGTGLALNVAGSGVLGAQAQKFAKSVTEGYGV